MNKYRLNKRAPIKRDCVKFGDYLVSLPSAPLVDVAPAYNYPIDENNVWGDCVCAGFDHFNQIVTGLLTGTQKNFTDAQLLAFYQTQNPNFDPNGTPQTNGPGSPVDGGMCIQTFLEYLAANKYIVAFASVDWTNPQEMQAAIYLGLSLIGGVQLQQAQIDQFESDQPWNPVNGSPIVGGHCVPPSGYNGGIYQVITWAKIQNCTGMFINSQMDECWIVITQDHINHPGFRDNFDLVGFAKAISEITGGKISIPLPQNSPIVTLTRRLDDGVETLGDLVYGNFQAKTLERSWKLNQQNISCIPKGQYLCQWKFMPSHLCYHYQIMNVPGRSGIFIHSGNFFFDSAGCVLLGDSYSDINNDRESDVLNSKATVNAFETLLNKESFTLIIQ